MFKRKPKDVGKRSGRPPGSPNREYLDLIVLPPACPRCEGTEFTPRAQTRSLEVTGCVPGENRVYNRIVWSKARCVACGQWLAFREYQLVAAAAE